MNHETDVERDMLGAKNNAIPMPKVANVPPPPVTNRPPAQRPPMHVVLSEALAENEQLRGMVNRLEGDIEVERRHSRELEHQLDREVEMRSYYERYCIEVNVHLDNIQGTIMTARERANTMGRNTKRVNRVPADDPHDASKIAPEAP